MSGIAWPTSRDGGRCFVLACGVVCNESPPASSPAAAALRVGARLESVGVCGLLSVEVCLFAFDSSRVDIGRGVGDEAVSGSV